MSVTLGVIVTASGGTLSPLEPDPDDINAYDIAHSLGNLCRYTGHTSSFYSVGEHSRRCFDWAVSEGVTDEYVLKRVLLHDAPEYAINDIARPLKELKEYSAYREAEDKLMDAICERFDIVGPEPDEVKEADEVLLATEVRDLMPGNNLFSEWINSLTPMDRIIYPWTPVEAKVQFLYALQILGVEFERPARDLPSWHRDKALV